MSEESQSSWKATGLERAPLAADLDADVCVVGAGIAGLTTAYMLARAGRKVVVLDDGPIAGGETQRTTAHLSTALDDRYDALERRRGRTECQLAAASHSVAIDRIESIVREERIACDFERLDGYLFAPSDAHRDLIAREMLAAHRAGLRSVELLPCVPQLPFATGACLRFPMQAQFHPLRYIVGLARACEQRDVRLFTSTHADSMEGGSRARVVTAAGPVVKASAIVVATNSPVNNRVQLHTKQTPYRTYVIGLGVPRGSIPKALYWDTLDPYHYFRLQSGAAAIPMSQDLLLVGGEDHRTGQGHELEPQARLEAWARARFPMAEAVQFRWSGQVLETWDGLAYIGRNPSGAPNVYVATGDSGMGMTHGTIAGMLLTDLILGRENPWEALYDPARAPLGAVTEWVKEFAPVAAQYGEWLTEGEVASELVIPPGHGAVDLRGGSKVAVYRDLDGTLYQRSAVCPHLGCIVGWNAFEQTWDCPCHGSRFDRFGTVVNGPANRDLAPLESSEGSLLERRRDSAVREH